MDEGLLVGLMNRLHRIDGHLIHSLLVVKDGCLVFEEYFDGLDVDLSDPDLFRGDTLNRVPKGFGRDVLHHSASVTKSVTAQLLGIALEEGYVAGIDAPLFSLFPEHAGLRSPGKEGITLRHMLAMTSGLSFDEESHPIADPRNDAHRLFLSDDPVAFVLEREVTGKPGATYRYNSGTTFLLGEIIRRATGMSLAEFARERLFGPLGISTYEWAPMQGAPDLPYGAGGLYLRPRDLAKIGQLMLQDGAWNDRQVLSQEWVRRSVTRQAQVARGGHFQGYGYHWRLGRFGGRNAYWAAGWGGQYVVVFPELELVFVQTAGAYGGESVPLAYDEILEAYVLPAVGGVGRSPPADEVLEDRPAGAPVRSEEHGREDCLEP